MTCWSTVIAYGNSCASRVSLFLPVFSPAGRKVFWWGHGQMTERIQRSCRHHRLPWQNFERRPELFDPVFREDRFVQKPVIVRSLVARNVAFCSVLFQLETSLTLCEL